MSARLNAPARVSTPNDRDIVMVREVNAPRHLVFEAWTNPKYLTRWLLGVEGATMPVCEVDLRPGGAWRYVWRNPDGSEMMTLGTFTEITPPSRLVTTEKWGGQDPEAVNVLELTESGGRTTMTLTMRYASKEIRDMVVRSGMAEGIERSFAWMEALLLEET